MFANIKPVRAALLDIRNDTISKETFKVATKHNKDLAESNKKKW
jgi:hypothetical protein